MRGIFAWVIFAIPTTYLIHITLQPIIRRLMVSMKQHKLKRKISEPPTPESIQMDTVRE